LGMVWVYLIWFLLGLYFGLVDFNWVRSSSIRSVELGYVWFGLFILVTVCWTLNRLLNIYFVT
jgi:hypothetical protein